MAHAKQQTNDKSNWKSTNIGMLVIGFLIFMPFGLVLLAILTFGKNVNLLGMFKDFWRRMTKGASFSQPDLWASATDNWKKQHNQTGNAAFDKNRAKNTAEFNEAQQQAFAQMAAEEQAFNEYQSFKKAAEDKEMFAKFKAAQNKPD